MAELITAARPYARAIFELAQEQERFDDWSSSLAFLSVVAHDPTMRAVLDSPRVSGQVAADLFISVCEAHIGDHESNLIKVLAEYRRLPLLPEIAALYEHYRSQAEGKINAEVISARALDDGELSAIAKALSTRLGREVKLSSKIDASLLGGAVIRAGDLVIDGSTRGKLNKLAKILDH